MAKRVLSKIRQLRLDMAARLGRAVTLAEVSTTTGIAISTLSRLENGQVKGIEFATLVKLAEFYGAQSTNDLISLEDARRALRLALA
jgi:DNA-binding Xre family transcriptional regulator